MFRAGREQERSPSHDDRACLEAVMWEVHVLRQLTGHTSIVKLCDVVEL